MLIKDQLNREIHLNKEPKRIVSLVPSQTELLVDLGLKEQLVGVTKFCVHPENIRSEKTVVGGTKTINLDKIVALRPDLIICNKEENTEEIIAQLESVAPVYVSNIITLADMFDFISACGKLCNMISASQELIKKIQVEITLLQDVIKPDSNMKVAYCIWHNPWMFVGKETFIHELLQLNNFENVFALEKRYPEIELDDEKLKKATHIFLSSEPFPFKDKHVTELEAFFPKAKVMLVDGEYFSWYGSRILKAITYFKEQHLAGW